MTTEHYPKTSIRLTSEDKAIIASLCARLGLRTTTDVIRLALRTLDARGVAEREDTMSTYTFAVQSTGRPYGSEAIPESAWSELSRHTTRIAAEKRLFCEIGDMRQRCNPRGGSLAAWDNHYRVVPLTPRTLTWQLVCAGANGHPCPDTAAVAVTAIWAANTGQPHYVDHLPPGWVSPDCCRVCYAREFGQYDPAFQR